MLLYSFQERVDTVLVRHGLYFRRTELRTVTGHVEHECVLRVVVAERRLVHHIFSRVMPRPFTLCIYHAHVTPNESMV